jgi:uncharacterized membrane protein YhaH (DUF805 family)
MTNEFSVFWILFGWDGRLGRLKYFVAFLAVTILSFLASKTLPKGALSLVTLLVLYVGLTLEAKRLHDIGLSALWIIWLNFLVLLWGVGTAVFLIPWHGMHQLPRGDFMKSWFLWMLVGCVLPLLGKAAWLIFYPGSEGTNPFGPAPGEAEPLPMRSAARDIVSMPSVASSVMAPSVRGRSGFGRRGR